MSINKVTVIRLLSLRSLVEIMFCTHSFVKRWEFCTPCFKNKNSFENLYTSVPYGVNNGSPISARVMAMMMMKNVMQSWRKSMMWFYVEWRKWPWLVIHDIFQCYSTVNLHTTEGFKNPLSLFSRKKKFLDFKDNFKCLSWKSG